MALALGMKAQQTESTQTEPAAVYITAGQSNADGREYISAMPSYLNEGYKYLKYRNVTSSSDGKFGSFAFDKRFAFCDITNYFIEKALQKDFYAIKCAYGGTAIDTAATYDHLPVWCADAGWIARNEAYRNDGTTATGKSLTKSLTEGFGDLVDVTLSKLEGGYDVKAIMWHQGESDRSQAGHYYKNFKDMITYMRNAIYAKTGKEKDKTLPFIFGTVPQGSKQYSSGVESAQRQVAAELENVYVIDLKDAGLRSDNLHFNAAWTEYVGKLMYNKLVELNLVNGEAIEAEKPHIPSASDTLKVDAERTWDFKAAWSSETKTALSTDEKWATFQKLGHRYSSSMAEYQELKSTSGLVFAETKGLFFKSPSGNRIILNPDNYVCFYADNLYMMVPKVSPGQTITIKTASAKGERGLTTESGEYLELVSGGNKSSSAVTNVWKVKESLKEPVDLVFHSNGGAIYVYSIEITSPNVQIHVGANQKTTFASRYSCTVKPFADLIKAYVATEYDADKDIITLEQVDTIPANTGALILGEECLVGAPVTTEAPTVAKNLFVGISDTIEVQPTETVEGVEYANFSLNADASAVEFRRLTAAQTMGLAAYLRLPVKDAEGANVVKTAVNDDTAIILPTLKNMRRGAWYSLDGLLVERPTKGIYICDGQKYLFK